MPMAKIAITLDQQILTRLDRLIAEHKLANRSRAIQEALEVRLDKLEDDQLVRELGNLDPSEEQEWAEIGIAAENETWPEY